MFVAIIRLPVYSMFRTINYRGNFIRSISTIKFCPSPEHERPAHNSTEQASHSYKLNRLILPYTFPTKNNSLNGHTVENELNPRIKFSLLPPCTGAERGERREVEEGSRELARSVQTVSTSTFADTCTPPSPPPSSSPPSSSRAFLPPSAPFPCSRERRCVSVEAEFPPLFSPLFPPPTPPFLRKFRVSFAALRRRYIPNHPYLSAYAIRASYIPARVPVENVLRSTVQFVQVPETFVSDVCLFHWGEEKKAEKKKKKKKWKIKTAREFVYRLSRQKERERERVFYFLTPRVNSYFLGRREGRIDKFHDLIT